MTQEGSSSTNERVLSGALWSAAATISSVLMGLPLTVFLVRVMTRADYGALALGSSIAGLLASFGGLGLAAGVARMGSFELARTGSPGLAAIVRAGIRVAALAASGLALLCLAAVLVMQRLSGLRSGVPVVLLLSPLVALIPFYGVFSGFLQATRQPRRAEGARILVAALSLALSLLVVVVGRPVPTELAAARAIAWLAGLAVLGLALRRWRRSIAEREHGAVSFRGLLRFSLPMLLTGVMWAAVSQLDVTFVGGVLGARAAGLYAPVSRMVEWIVTGFSFAGAYLLPPLTAAVADDDSAEVRRLYHSTSRWGLAVAAPLLGVIVATPTSALRLLYGSPYAGLGTIARILALGAVAHVALGYNGLVLEAHGRPAALAVRSGLALGLNVVACAVLIPRFGLAGAAWSTAVALLTLNAMNSWFLFRRFGIRPWDGRLAFTVGSIAAGTALAWLVAPVATSVLVRCLLAAAVAGAAGGGAALLVSDPAERRSMVRLVRQRGGGRRGRNGP